MRAPLRPAAGVNDAGGMANETINPAEADPKHYQMEFLRRRIRQGLYAVQLGLTGGEDFIDKSKGTGSSNLAANSAASAGGSGAAPPAEKKGMHAIAKGDDQEKVKQYAELYRELGGYPYDQDPLRPGWAPVLPNDRWADPKDDRVPDLKGGWR